MEDELMSVLAIDIRMGRVENVKNWVTKLSSHSAWKCLFQIYVNDVGVGAPTLASYIWNKYSNVEPFPKEAIKVATKMAKSPKTGLCSWINTVFFKNAHRTTLRVDSPHKKVSERFSKILRKCAAKIHNSCYNSSHCDDWDPMDQYELFYWAARLSASSMWEVIIEISLAFPKIVQSNINALKSMFDALRVDEASGMPYIIQCLLILSQPNEWHKSAERSFAAEESIEDQIPSYAHDITTEKGRLYLETIGRDRGWSREYTLGFGVRNYYRVSCKVKNSHVVPVRSYREFAIYLETSDVGCRYCCRIIPFLDYGETMYQRILNLSSIRKLPKNTTTALRSARGLIAKPTEHRTGRNALLKIRNEFVTAELTASSTIGFIKIPGYYETLVRCPASSGFATKTVRPQVDAAQSAVRCSAGEVRQKYKLDKMKRFLKMETLPALAVASPLALDPIEYSLVYEYNEYNEYNVTSSALRAASPLVELHHQRSLTKIYLFQWLMGFKSEIVLVGDKVYSINERRAKVEKPVLPAWAYTPIGIDTVKTFIKSIRLLRTKYFK
jgi:hypothetical protein